MADFDPIQIPPQGAAPVDPVQRQKPSSTPPEGSPGFQDVLKQQLSELSRETEEVAKASSPTFDDMAKVMNNAKNVYEDTMHTHQLLQHIFDPSSEKPDSDDNKS